MKNLPWLHPPARKRLLSGKQSSSEIFCSKQVPGRNDLRRGLNMVLRQRGRRCFPCFIFLMNVQMLLRSLWALLSGTPRLLACVYLFIFQFQLTFNIIFLIQICFFPSDRALLAAKFSARLFVAGLIHRWAAHAYKQSQESSSITGLPRQGGRV